MKIGWVNVGNVIFVLYRACLDNKLTLEKFIELKHIVETETKQYNDVEMFNFLGECSPYIITKGENMMNMTKNRTQETYPLSFRCYFPSDDGASFVTKYQRLPLKDVAKWVKAYQFTHPNCLSISVKIWLTEREECDDDME